MLAQVRGVGLALPVCECAERVVGSSEGAPVAMVSVQGQGQRQVRRRGQEPVSWVQLNCPLMPVKAVHLHPYLQALVH